MQTMNNRSLLISICFTLVILFSTSCSRELTPREAKAWISDAQNGLTDSAVVGEYILRATIQPSVVDRKSPTANHGSSKGSKLVRVKAEIVRTEQTGRQDILLDGISSEQQFAERLESMAFNTHSSMTLILGDSMRVQGIDTFFEQNLGLGDKRILIVTFPIKEDEFEQYQSAKLIWTETLFGAGRIVFVFRPSAINELEQFI